MEIQNHKQKMIIFGAILLSILLFAIDFMIIVPAMPKILTEIGGLKYINWVFTAFMLTQTIASPIYGKLSDIFSRKKMFLLAIVIFVISSMLAGLSTNIYELIVARAIQGIGGGAIMVTAISMIGEIFSIKERSKYQGYMSAVFGLASVAGPIFGAYITDSFSWRWIFFINFPIGIISFLLIYLYLPKSLHQDKKSKIDYVGSFLLTAFLVPMILMFSSIADLKVIDRNVIIFFALTIVSFVLFYLWERKNSSPIFSHHLFYDRYFVVPAIMTFNTAIILFGTSLYIQIFAQKVLGLPIKEAGLITTAMVVPMTFMSAISGQIISRTGKYKMLVVVGSLIIFLSILNFAYQLNLGMSKDVLLFCLIPIGLGMGTMMSVFNIVIQVVYGRERLGEVTGALQLTRGVGGVFGTALLGFIFGYFIKDINGDTGTILNTVKYIYYVLSIICFISLVTSLFMKEKVIIH